MSSLYLSYQVTGGTELWTPIHAGSDLDTICPTFITVLACDTLLAKDSPKEMVEGAKYLGPMYLDLDSEQDIGAAIQGGKDLWKKLETYGLLHSDVEVYLSGKKGLHFTIPPQVFMEKQMAVNKLPLIYKEMAFTLAVDTVDFSVYSMKRGRMFRTCYNQRDNGKWKVQISIDQLKALTAASYNELCSEPQPRIPAAPTYKPKLAILYEGIRQKVAAQKRIKSKPVDAATLRRHLPILQRLMRGENVKEGVGFNKIAIQLGLYAHEAKLTEDELVSECAGLLANHTGDGFRYNTAYKRETELRRMFSYLEDTSGYEYSINPISAMLEKETVTVPNEFAEEGEEEEEIEAVEDSSGLFLKGANYFVSNEQGEKHIMDARFRQVSVLKLPETEQISCIAAKIQVGAKVTSINLERADFVSSASLHKVVSLHGASFTGTDVHARYIYTHMLREAKIDGKTVYATDKEGLDVLCMPLSTIEEARTPFVVWSDAFGVRLPQSLVDQGLDVRFVGYPSPEGVMKTDLAKAPAFPEWATEGDNKANMLTMLKGLLLCQDPISVSKLLGWCTACFYSQMFRKGYGKFPLMHINGAAGSGKSEFSEALMHLYYYEGEPVIMSPSSSIFAITTVVTGSASIPVIVDEYKPHEMGVTKHNDIKGMFRSNYNGHFVSKGGGNRSKDSFGALNSVKLNGPIMFIAEAIEQETALLQRCVLVSLRRPSGMLTARYTPKWRMFQSNKRCLSILGQYLAASIVQNYSVDTLKAEFDPVYAEARNDHMPDAIAAEKLSVDEAQRKANVNERVVYNHAVSKFGLMQFKKAVFKMYPEEAEALQVLFTPLEDSIYMNMDEVTVNTIPEYVKVLIAMSDMTRFGENEGVRLANKLDYEIGSIGDMTTISLIGRLCFNKYRQYCKQIGAQPLFNGEAPFIHAMKGSNLFIKAGTGTSKLQQETMILNYESLLRLGVPQWSK